jgi:hypothetical protein
VAGIAAKMTWVFGTDPDKNAEKTEGTRSHGPHNNVVGSTGAGVAFNTRGWGLNYAFQVDSNDSGAAYQIRASRTSSGPWAILSSNSTSAADHGTSTAIQDLVSLPGPMGPWLSPRVESMASTANYVIISMTATE